MFLTVMSWVLTRSASRAAAFAAIGAVALTVIVRALTLAGPARPLDADEAITGLMARGILDGTFPIFFGNQNYQGALEQYLQAPLMAIAPGSAVALRIVQVALCALIAWLVYLLGARVCRSPWGGVLAATLYAVGPYYSVLKGVRSHGGYDMAIVAGLTLTLLALSFSAASPRARWYALAMGLAAGVGIWENPTAIYLLLPAGLWAIASARGHLRQLVPWATGGLALGLAPVFIDWANRGVSLPLAGGPAPTPSSFIDRLSGLASPVLSQFLGVKDANPAINPGIPSALVAGSAVVALGVAVWLRRRGLWSLLTIQRSNRMPIDIVILTFLITPFIYAASSFTWFVQEPRYVFTLYPYLAIALAAAAFAVRAPTMRVTVAVCLVAASALLLGTALVRANTSGAGMYSADGSPVHSHEAPAVLSKMQRLGIRHAYANYWIAAPLQFTAGASPVVAPLDAGTTTGHTLAVVAREASPAVIAADGPSAITTEDTLRRGGHAFTRHPVGHFVIFSDIAPPWRPAGKIPLTQ
jgi:4-amino-4-deoxy-L-arabinose transferase-like glycosyltransferase